jgi:uncharacterized protein DUF1524
MGRVTMNGLMLGGAAKRLGNMVLLPSKINSNLGNKSFKAKSKILKDSVLSITSEVAEYADWGPEQIAARQVKLAAIAPKVWPLKWK